MKRVKRDKVVYEFSGAHAPVEYVDPGEIIILETEDALGGQIKDEETPLENLDWSRANPATGPIYVNGAEPGDTLIVEVLDIKFGDRGVILVVPKHGALGYRPFRPRVKIVPLNGNFAYFNDVKVKLQPTVGTIGVAPEGEPMATAIPYKHGGNLDAAQITRGAKLYLPVAVEGALFAAGDLHATQADGEACVAAIEVAGELLLRFSLIKGAKPSWPILETKDHYSILTADESLDKAAQLAVEEAVKSLMKARGWSFEEAYMFSSIGVEVEVNQIVDPKKGARATIPKELIEVKHLLSK